MSTKRDPGDKCSGMKSREISFGRKTIIGELGKSFSKIQRPQFDSFPAFDMRLILSMARAGYTKIKMSFGVSGTYFGDDYPNEIVDCYTKSTNWRSISEFVRDGVDCGTRKPNAYFDFHMSL